MCRHQQETGGRVCSQHSKLDPGAGLWISPCESVHSFRDEFAIDLVYLDPQEEGSQGEEEMVPWRLSACLTAPFGSELPVGAIEASTRSWRSVWIRELG